MLSVYLCDDSHEMIEKYTGWMDQIAIKNGIDIVVTKFNSGESLISYFSNRPQQFPNIIVLDILMHELDGIETAKRLRKIGCKSMIIFLTASEDYVFDAFDAFPIQYLIKQDTSQEKMEQVLLRARKWLKEETQECYMFNSKYLTKVIPYSDILYFELLKGRATIHYGKVEKTDHWTSLETLEKKLEGKPFIRTHRSYIVNLQYVVGLQQKFISLKTGDQVPVGITYREKVKDSFYNFVQTKKKYYS